MLGRKNGTIVTCLPRGFDRRSGQIEEDKMFGSWSFSMGLSTSQIKYFLIYQIPLIRKFKCCKCYLYSSVTEQTRNKGLK